jgi:hypothetical protein
MNGEVVMLVSILMSASSLAMCCEQVTRLCRPNLPALSLPNAAARQRDLRRRAAAFL